MHQPLVSAVIPAFNREGSVRAAVESVLVQSVQDLEVIVVDDGSTDGTRDVVRGIDDARVRLIARERNGGASAARNTGIRAARGALIGFLDSDDVWLEGKLAAQVEALGRARPGVAVSCTGAEIHLLDHGVIRVQLLESTGDWARQLAMDCNLSPGSTQLSRREIFDEIGFLDERLPRFEDWDWLVRYTQKAGIAAIREPFARIYNRRGRLGDQVAYSAALFLAKHNAILKRLAPCDRRQAIADLWLQAAGTYAFEGKLAAALSPALRAMRQRPWHASIRLLTGAAAVTTARRRGTTSQTS